VETTCGCRITIATASLRSTGCKFLIASVRLRKVSFCIPSEVVINALVNGKPTTSFRHRLNVCPRFSQHIRTNRCDDDEIRASYNVCTVQLFRLLTCEPSKRLILALCVPTSVGLNISSSSLFPEILVLTFQIYSSGKTV
jgi:hypothetical protein